jgi:predicted transcriptional regulator
VPELPKPTQAELAILNVLWREGPSTVRRVHERLTEVQNTGYTTVLKLLQIMHQKGLVQRDSSSRAHIYEAALPEEDTRRNLVRELLETAFQGSAKKLVLSALSVQTSTPEELAEIRELIEKLEGES